MDIATATAGYYRYIGTKTSCTAASALFTAADTLFLAANTRFTAANTLFPAANTRFTAANTLFPCKCALYCALQLGSFPMQLRFLLLHGLRRWSEPLCLQQE